MGALAALILTLLLGGGFLLWWLQRPAAQAPRQVVQFDIPPPPGTIFAPSIARQYFAISPDGKRLAFTATSAAGTNIWIRELASLEMRPVPGTDGAWSMFWAPDSRSIFYSVKRTLKEANLETGSGRSVAELTAIPQLGTWRSNGDLLLYLGEGSIRELRTQDGSLRKGPVFEGLRWPQFLPGGDRLIYTIFDKQLQQSRAMAVGLSQRQAGFLDADRFAGPIRAAAAAPANPDTWYLFAAGACSRSPSTRIVCAWRGSLFPSRRTSCITARTFRPRSQFPRTGCWSITPVFPTRS